MANHKCKELDKLLEMAEGQGCSIVTKNGKLQVFPPKHIKASPYLVHYGERAFHPVRRFLKNICQLRFK
jgi:hypothetical protein